MRTITPDPFWDGRAGGGVRCSSEGELASQYQDPATHFCEGNGGRSVASLLPGGLRGVIIPRATTFGGSRGFDPHKPRLINIDPDIKGQSCVVDLSKITKEAMEEAFVKAAQNPLAASDIHLLAAQTFHNLAIDYEPVGTGPSRSPRLVERRAPLGDLGTYVVPRASPGGGQILEEPQERPMTPQDIISPSVTPRQSPAINPSVAKLAGSFRLNEDPHNMLSNVGMPVPTAHTADENGNPLYREATNGEPLDGYQIQQPITPPMQQQGPPQRQGFIDQSSGTTAVPRKLKLASHPTGQVERQLMPQAQIPAPETRVTFEVEGWGEFEAMYHEVIKNDCVLVLCFDTRFKGGGKYFPPATDKIMAVKVDGQDTVYFVHSYGTRFQHGGYEYCMLVIDQDSEVSE